MSQPVFLYDLASPWCWVAGELINSALEDGPPVWQPVAMQSLAPEAYAAIASIGAEEVAAHTPMPLQLPTPLPADTATAMLAATFAKKSGRAVAFSLAAFRQAFAAARDLSVTDNVLIAAAACELHPRAVLKGIETRGVRDDLHAATETAREQGVTDLPALVAPDGTVESGAALALRLG